MRIESAELSPAHNRWLEYEEPRPLDEEDEDLCSNCGHGLIQHNDDGCVMCDCDEAEEEGDYGSNLGEQNET